MGFRVVSETEVESFCFVVVRIVLGKGLSERNGRMILLEGVHKPTSSALVIQELVS